MLDSNGREFGFMAVRLLQERVLSGLELQDKLQSLNSSLLKCRDDWDGSLSKSDEDVHTMIQMLEQIITNAEAIKSEISYMAKYDK